MGNSLCGLSQAPISNKIQLYPVTVENMSHQENKTIQAYCKKNRSVLDDGINMEDELKIPIGNRKHIFWHTSINDSTQKLKCI